MAKHGTLAVVLAFALTSLSTVVVALRFYTRYFLIGKLGSPDWVILVALISTWASAVVNKYQVHFFDYSHVHDMDSFAKVSVGSNLTMWIYRIVYIVDTTLIKISILLFYNYVASTHKAFHIIVRSTIAFIAVAGLAMGITSILACRPVADAWSFEVFIAGFQGIKPTQCYNPTIIWLVNAGFNLGTDVVIWLLPFPFVLNLQSMPVRRRLELVAIFSVGIIAIAASAIRLWIITEWLSAWTKQGANTGNLLIWGQVEQHAGIIAASVPFLRPLARKAIKAITLRHREAQPSPGPAAKLLRPDHFTPEQPMPVRTPIIPSPAPTIGSDREIFRAPISPLSPIAPVTPMFGHNTV